MEDEIENKEKKKEQNPMNKEYEKLLKKQQQQEAELNLLIQQQQMEQQQMEEYQKQQEQKWTDSTRVMVSKQCMIDLYFCLFVGNETEGVTIVDVLCNSMSSYQGQDQEGRMLVDKQLMQNLQYYNEKQDLENMYAVINEIFYTLSVGQRREIVNILVNKLMENGSIEDMKLIEALKDSVGNPMFFRTG